MWSTIAASVVDLPEPVVPVTRMIPRASSARRLITGGRSSSSTRADVERDHPAGDRDRAALPERVDAEAGEARDRVGEVDLAVAGELGEAVAAVNISRSTRSVSAGRQGLRALDRGQGRRGGA